MPTEPGYPQPSDFLDDLRFVYRNEEPPGGEKTARRRRMRRSLEANPDGFLEIMARQQEHYDRRVAAWWARKHRLEDRAKKVVRERVLTVSTPLEETTEAENRAMDVLEGL